MIGQLTGKLVKHIDAHVLIDVGGVGYEVEVPQGTLVELPEAGEDLVLYTHLVVREDAHLLFGFMAEQDRRLFRLLIKVNGIGPKLALSILSVMDGAQFSLCVAQNDSNTLLKLPGVGRKTAERLIIEMRDRLRDWEDTSPLPGQKSAQANSQGKILQEAETALASLGYKPQEVAKALSEALSKLENSAGILSTEQLLRETLRLMGKR